MNHPECSCQKCCVACRTKPGFFMLEDIYALAEKSGKPEYDATCGQLAASDGAKLLRVGVGIINVPTIVPAQRQDGSCVFLEGDKCSLHGTPAKPFGCREFNVCDVANNDTHNKTLVAMQSIELDCAKGGMYSKIWDCLHRHGLDAKPLIQRAKAFREAVHEIDSAQKTTLQSQTD